MRVNPEREAFFENAEGLDSIVNLRVSQRPYQFAEDFYAPGHYSDQLADAGIPAILALECAIPVICNMSKKYGKHPRCASSHAPSTIPIGVSVHVKLDAEGGFKSKTHVNQVINQFLGAAPHFPLMPPVNEENEIHLYTSGRKFAYKDCPETDCEEVSPIGEPEISIVEKLKKQDQPLRAERVKIYRQWYGSTQNCVPVQGAIKDLAHRPGNL